VIRSSGSFNYNSVSPKDLWNKMKNLQEMLIDLGSSKGTSIPLQTIWIELKPHKTLGFADNIY